MKIKYLRRSWSTLVKCITKLLQSNNLNDFNRPVDKSEPIVHYLYSRGEFGGERVKKNGFLPYPGRELSVFRIIGLNKTEVIELSLNARKDKRPKAYATLVANDVYNTNLALEPDNNPIRHANIVGWPNLKEDQIELAIVLALSSKLNKL